MPTYDGNDGAVIYIPEVGDRITYAENRISYPDAEITKIRERGGYTEVWLAGESEDNDPTFNINHSSGKPNSAYSRGGMWKLVTRKVDSGPKTYLLPAEPDPNVTQVESIHDPRTRYVRDGRWWSRASDNTYRYTWLELLCGHLDGLREVREDPYDAAVRRLRELTPTQLNALTLRNIDVNTVIRKVVSG